MKKTRKLQLAALLVGMSAAVAGFAVANDSVKVQASETPVFAMEQGASVRTKPDDSGIRWITNVNKAWYDSQNVPAGATVQFGTFVTSASKSTVEDLTAETAETLNATQENIVKDIPSKSTPTFANDTTFTYYSAITFGNVAAEKQQVAYAAELVARSYMKYSTDDGATWKYKYADSHDNQRCIRAVALEALEDPDSDLDANEQTTVKGYVGTKETDVNMDGDDGVCETVEEAITGDYAVAYKGAKKVGTFTDGKLTLNADFNYNENETLTLFDAEGNYAKTAECKYITQYIDTADEFTTAFKYAVTVNDPEYKMTTATGYYMLNANIVLDGTAWGSNLTFSGTLDGAGYSITGLNIRSGSKDNFGGLFHELDNATIKNLAVVEAKISGQAAGLFSFFAPDVTFDNVYVSISAEKAFGEYYEMEQNERVLTDQSQKAGLVNRGNDANITVKNSVIYMPETLSQASGFVSSYGKPTLTITGTTFIGGNGNVVGIRSGAASEPKYTEGGDDFKVIDAVQAYKDLYSEICTDGKITQAPADTTFGSATNANGWSEMQFNAYQDNHPLKVFGKTDVTQVNFIALTNEIVVLTDDVTLSNTYLGKSGKFTGVFDGQGYKIDGITTKRSSAEEKEGVGSVFCALLGSVKNLALVGIASTRSGLLADAIGGTTYIENVYLEAGLGSKNSSTVARRFASDAAVSMKNVVINVTKWQTTSGAVVGYMGGETSGAVGVYMENCSFVAPDNRPIGNTGGTTYIQAGAGNTGYFFWDIGDVVDEVEKTEDDGLMYYATMDLLKEGETLTDFQKTWLGISQSN